MKKKFLPKELDGEVRERFCVNIEDGASSTELHFHGCLELIHMEKGRATVSLDGGDIALADGDSFILPIGKIHRCICTDPTARRIVIGIENELVAPARTSSPSLLPFSSAVADESLCFRAADSPELVAEISELERLWGSTATSSHLLAQAAIMKIYALLYAALEKADLIPKPNRENATVTAITDFISEHYAESITAASVAAHLGISYSNMAKLLRLHRSQGFSELLSEARTDAAKRLLITTALTITEIGYECGYTDTSYFIKSFKHRTGVTPSSYRRRAEPPST